jgi:hypothetical protein
MSMDAESPDDFAAIVTTANGQLSMAFGRETRLGHVVRISEDGRRNVLLRCRDLSGKSPASFIIKKVVADAYNSRDAQSWDTQRFFTDWAGAEFLSRTLSARQTPRFYGGDGELGFFILEDLGEHRSLVEPLLEEDAGSAGIALTSFSRCLGAVHAGTIGRVDEYAQILHARNPHGGVVPQTLTEFAERVQRLRPQFDRLGIRDGAEYAQEVETVISEINRPGPFFSYIHGDPCPDNVFWKGGALRLIDFEFGGFGHALTDAAYGRMLFPSCWCANRLPSDLIRRMETAYRAELVTACPEAEEDRVFEDALAHACAFWLLSTLAGQLAKVVEEDRPWGISTVRQRVLGRLDAFITTSEEFRRLPALRAMAARLQNRLVQEWPETVPMPTYPSFNARALLPKEGRH